MIRNLVRRFAMRNAAVVVQEVFSDGTVTAEVHRFDWLTEKWTCAWSMEDLLGAERLRPEQMAQLLEGFGLVVERYSFSAEEFPELSVYSAARAREALFPVGELCHRGFNGDLRFHFSGTRL